MACLCYVTEATKMPFAWNRREVRAIYRYEKLMMTPATEVLDAADKRMKLYRSYRVQA